LETKDFHIEYGDMGTEGEDCIVADKEGLIKLKSAIDEAIGSGVYFTDLDEFSGIICKKKDYFQDKPAYETSLLGNFFSLLVGGFIFIIFMNGIFSVFSWFVDN
jgi:hypothetical protein